MNMGKFPFEAPIPETDISKLFELLDRHKPRLGGGQPLEAHLVAVDDENGEIIGEVVELRTAQGAPVLAMPQSDFEELRGWK